jgi:hypothetical protein
LLGSTRPGGFLLVRDQAICQEFSAFAICVTWIKDNLN